jgi:hypothetical protein
LIMNCEARVFSSSAKIGGTNKRRNQLGITSLYISLLQ